MSIQIKDEDVLFGLMEKRHDPMLCRIIRWIAKEWGDIYITESYRKQRHANDLHGVIPVRATDLRSRIYVMPEMVEEKINENWQYDPDRLEMRVCVYHAVCPNCKTNHLPPHTPTCRNCGADIRDQWHFHIQTHPKTQRRTL
jgi:lipopolysaccharide biosynthesis regulator YciM